MAVEGFLSLEEFLYKVSWLGTIGNALDKGLSIYQLDPDDTSEAAELLRGHWAPIEVAWVDHESAIVEIIRNYHNKGISGFSAYNS